MKDLFVYIDESGNFDFSKKGTRNYQFTAMIVDDPLMFDGKLNKLKMDLLSRKILPNLSDDYLSKNICNGFHATEDKQSVRNLVFDVIKDYNNIKVNSLFIRKNRTYPALRDPEVFYPRFLGSLVTYICKSYIYNQLFIFVDGCVTNKNKEIFKKSIKTIILDRNPSTKFCIYFPSSSSYNCLQVVDYVNWAIFKKVESGNLRSYELIENLLQRPEKDIFKDGSREYY